MTPTVGSPCFTGYAERNREMNRNLKRRLCFILVAALLAALIPALPFTESASVYGASYDAFTRDARWKDGTSWGA